MNEVFSALTTAVERATIIALPAAFVWGILSIVLSPCSLTSVPLVVGYINRGQQVTARRAMWVAACFAGGTLVTIGAAGAIALAAGRLLGETGIWTKIVVAAVLVVVGLYLAGALRLPGGIASPTLSPRRDALGALLLGLVMGLALSPCTFAYLAPILAVVLDLSANKIGLGVAMLVAFALGHGAVMVLLGAFAGTLSRVLSWNERSRGAALVRKVCGVLLLLGAGYVVYTII